MKRAIAAVLSFLLLPACTFPPESISTGDTEEKISSVMELIKDGEKEKLADEFSDNVSRKDLLEEIDEMYGLFGGGIISWDEPTHCGYTQKASDHGDITLYTADPRVKNVKAGNKETYDIDIDYTAVNDKEPEAVGINCIMIRKQDPDKTYGEVILKIDGQTE